MEIDVGVSLNLAARLEALSFVRPKPRARETPDVLQSLTRMLFGETLSADALQEARQRLLDLRQQADALEDDERLPTRETLGSIPSGWAYRNGSLAWVHPPELADRSHPVTLQHVVHTHRLLKSWEEVGPAWSTVSRSTYVVHSAGRVIQEGEDRIDLTRGGLRQLQAPGLKKVTFTRMPPEYPRRTELLQVVRGG